MIFRRSLVRELTATAVGLFLVLLAILFTNLVLRLLARAAGGAVAPGRHPGAAGVQRAVLLQYPAVGRAVSDRAADAFALVSRQRDDCLVHVGSVADRVPASRSCCLPRHFWSRSSRCRCSCRRGPNSARSNSSASSSRATTSRSSRRDSSANSRRANLVVFVESINPLEQHHAERLPALGRGQAGRHDGRRARAARGHAQRRPLHRAGARPPLPGHARDAPITASSSSSSSDAGSSPAKSARCRRRRRRFRPRRSLVADGRVERAELFWRISVPISALVLTLLAVPLAYVNPRMGRSFNLVAAAFLYMLYSNCLNIVQSLIAQGQARPVGRPPAAARDRAARRRAAVSPAAVRDRALRARAAPTSARLTLRCGVAFAPRAAAPMKTLQRYIGRDVLFATLLIFGALLALFAFFDLIHELGDVGRGDYTISRALLFVTLNLPSRLYELFPVAALIGTLFAVVAARRQLRVHGHAGVRHVARARRMVGAARRHSARGRDVPRRRIRRAAGGADRADGRARPATSTRGSSRSSSSPASGSSRT